jgi:hypothetical protein
LFSPKWNEGSLRKRSETEPRSFERGFRLRAFSDDEISFPDYEKCRVPGVSIGEIQRSNWIKVSGVDLSSKKRPGNVIVTVALGPNRRRHVCDVRYGKWKSNETCEQINTVNSLFNPTVFMVEDNGYQAALIEWAQAFPARFPWWMKVEPTTTTGGLKFDPEKGLPVLQTEFKNNAWVFPLSEWEGATPDDPAPRGHWARLDYELRNHPLAATTDGVMALWFARQGLEIWGSSYGEVGVVGDISSR